MFQFSLRQQWEQRLAEIRRKLEEIRRKAEEARKEKERIRLEKEKLAKASQEQKQQAQREQQASSTAAEQSLRFFTQRENILSPASAAGSPAMAFASRPLLGGSTGNISASSFLFGSPRASLFSWEGMQARTEATIHTPNALETVVSAKDLQLARCRQLADGLVIDKSRFESTVAGCRTEEKYAIVMHCTAGPDLDGAINALHSQKYSYHYIIDRDGKVYQIQPDNARCGHALVANGGTIGVSYVGGMVNKDNTVEYPINEKQIESSKKLLAKLVLEHPIGAITRHGDIQGDRVDPPGVEFDSIAKELGLRNICAADGVFGEAVTKNAACKELHNYLANPSAGIAAAASPIDLNKTLLEPINWSVLDPVRTGVTVLGSDVTSGSSVVEFQKMLVQAGLAPDGSLPIGRYKGTTQETVKNCQGDLFVLDPEGRQVALVVDGKAGARTFHAVAQNMVKKCGEESVPWQVNDPVYLTGIGQTIGGNWGNPVSAAAAHSPSSPAATTPSELRNADWTPVYFSQKDPKWAGHSYGFGTTIAGAGCGITSYAMVANGYGVLNKDGKPITPPDVADFSVDNEFRVRHQGTKHDLFDAAAKYDGLGGAVELNNDMTKIIEALSSGHPVIVALQGKTPANHNPYTNSGSGHIFVLVGAEKSGDGYRLSVNDPSGRTKETTSTTLQPFILNSFLVNKDTPAESSAEDAGHSLFEAAQEKFRLLRVPLLESLPANLQVKQPESPRDLLTVSSPTDLFSLFAQKSEVSMEVNLDSNVSLVAADIARILPNENVSSSDYGYDDPEGQKFPGDKEGNGHHLALDWTGEGVFSAPEAGRVIRAESSSDRSGEIYGGIVSLRTEDGRLWVMRHVEPGVNVDDQVLPGQPLGTVTPWSDHPEKTHVHIELYRTGSKDIEYRAQYAMNPYQYLKSKGVI